MSQARASVFYQTAAWRLGHAAVRALPSRLASGLARQLAAAYAGLNPARRRIVVENVLPLVGGDPERARAAGNRLFRNFADKLVDLWRFETGAPAQDWFHEWSGQEYLAEARKPGRGVLFVTPHLGNWEFGAPVLASRGIKLMVVTQAEPHPGLTRLRLASRSRAGIETVVIGSDPFSFVEIVRQLDAGASVALLVDRPRAGAGVPVNFFGRRLLGSLAPSALARATGCAILPVYIPKTGDGYSAHILPSVPYDRAELRDPAACQKLAQGLIDIFAPAIQRHADQWYHFVPIWRHD